MSHPNYSPHEERRSSRHRQRPGCARSCLTSIVGRKIMMRALPFVALVLLAGAAFAAEPVVEIEFEYAPSWQDAKLVQLIRLSDGKIYCAVLTRPELRSAPSERKWKTIKEVSVSADTFARLEREFETTELKHSAEKDWGAYVTEGTRWRLKKRKGSFAIEIIAHNPDMEAEGAPIVQLARSISVAASADLFPK
jgi:hypothetical protein